MHSEWFRAIRRWTLVSWAIQTPGLILGAWWASGVLGWGGYWGWDPVENAALLRWLTATAFLDSTLVQERRGMLKMWNLGLVIASFALSIFGTFEVRSGVISSVHSFSYSAIGPYFLGFLAVILAASIALFVYRLPRLRPEHEFDSIVSREGSFLLNNFVLARITLRALRRRRLYRRRLRLRALAWLPRAPRPRRGLSPRLRHASEPPPPALRRLSRPPRPRRPGRRRHRLAVLPTGARPQLPRRLQRLGRRLHADLCGHRWRDRERRPDHLDPLHPARRDGPARCRLTRRKDLSGLREPADQRHLNHHPRPDRPL